MNTHHQELQKQYPGKPIFENKTDGEVTELVCEIEPTSEHPEYSVAIAVINKSPKHKHNQTTETYKVIKGKLKLHVGGDMFELHEGDWYIIEPGQVHWAEGDAAWVECRSEPGWTVEDYITV